MTVNSNSSIKQFSRSGFAKFVPIFYYKVSDIRKKALYRKNKIATLHSGL